MGSRVVARNSVGHRVEASNGTASIVLDMSKLDGGEATGLSPHETLLAALGGCTAMTLRVYSARKGWPLEGVDVTLTHEKPPPGAPPEQRETIGVAVKLFGPLDAAQQAKLMEIAQKCPVYKTLLADLAIVETLVA